jgi:hypothetical protein
MPATFSEWPTTRPELAVRGKLAVRAFGPVGPGGIATKHQAIKRDVFGNPLLVLRRCRYTAPRASGSIMDSR